VIGNLSLASKKGKKKKKKKKKDRNGDLESVSVGPP